MVVGAATGNPPDEGGFLSAELGGEPSGAPVTDFVLPGSDTDLAAPTYGLLSVAVNGATCVVPEVATSWSAAEVSGVLALLRSRYPHDRPAQAVARLLDTANGTTAAPTRLTGVGVVQPLQALTRPLDPRPDGAVRSPRSSTTRCVRSPPSAPRTCLPTPARRGVVGLIGGGLVVALLLRPVLARRRSRADVQPGQWVPRSGR